MGTLAALAFPIPHLTFPALSEADLAVLWEGQRFPPEALLSARAGTLRVIYRGRRTGGPGPDFRDAVIATRTELLQGDVELHVRSSDFRRHGHHRDPSYDGLVLHVVFHDDGPGKTELASGRLVPVAALGEWAAARSAELRRRLAEPPLWQEPCFSAVERLGAESAGVALDRLGDMRFRQKVWAFAKEMGHGETAALERAVWAGLVEALGYGGQRELMRAVASEVSWEELAAALASTPRRERRDAAYRLLAGALDSARLRLPLVLRPLRPWNRPEARLKGAAALAARFAGRGLWPALSPSLAEAAAGRPRRLIAGFTVPGAVGRARAVEIVANAVLPAAAAAGGVVAAESAYRALPLPARYGAVRHIGRALSGRVRLDARRQQGMLYLLKQYCTQGGCGRCPLS
jgi:hypothetical protein